MSGLSKSNPRVRGLRRLLRDSKYRQECQKFAAEGLEVLKESIASSAIPSDVFVMDNHPVSTEVELLLNSFEVSIWYLEEKLFASLATTITPQPVISIFQTIDIPFDHLMNEDPTFLIAGVEIREPGNAGSLIRTAAAAGADGVIFSENSVDLYNPKTIRSSAGAIFRLPIVRSIEIGKKLKFFKEKSIITLGLAPKGNSSYLDFDFKNAFVVLLGNEAAGLNPDTLNQVDHIAKIEMGLGIESLNVSNAASAVLFEARRQRNL